ncbi:MULTISPECIES: glycosyltransferase family 4 protein [Prochlorococcus]|uniref:Glycosyltransferase n=2 Tax=Prochlorococcaceae TaxID=2881426 RepID=Q7VAX4_PROMA|nr:glycosyltransferase family 1 protein [Prochlorococcus marinus]AAQ00373.1 Glycosyltransferase [Prochlorococcus marinus subsp. marinus str. CCMP1375]KGG33403.1 putative glycosyl transferase [Prochlorococcus marinus str. SS51]
MAKKIIAMDLRYAEVPNTGLTRFACNLFYKVINSERLNNQDFLLLLPPKKLSYHLNSIINAIDKSKVKIIYWNKSRKILWKIPFLLFDPYLFRLLKQNKVQLFVCPFIDPPILPGIKVVSTIHDLTFIKVKNFFPKYSFIKKIISEIRILITIFTSNYILTVSLATKRQLISKYKALNIFIGKKLSNITIIPNAISHIVSSKESNSINIGNAILDLEFILYVGDRRPHKNIKYLIELVKSLHYLGHSKIFLVIAGSTEYENISLSKMIKENSDFVIEVISPNDSELNCLYTKCKCFCLLSLSEGFGIPVLEAAAHGAKVVVSNIASLVEIAPINSLILDLNTKDLNPKLFKEYLMNEKRPNAESVIDYWTWDRSADIMCEFITNLKDE